MASSLQPAFSDGMAMPAIRPWRMSRGMMARRIPWGWTALCAGGRAFGIRKQMAGNRKGKHQSEKPRHLCPK
jgi:hypothetical protein